MNPLRKLSQWKESARKAVLCLKNKKEEENSSFPLGTIDAQQEKENG